VARGSDKDETQALCDAGEKEVRAALGENIFGQDDDTLPGVVVRLLAEKNATIALAESCTGGMIASLLVNIPGASNVLKNGIVSYANEAKTELLGVPAEVIEEHGAVSKEVAILMARNARERARADYSLAVTGIAGPGGGTKDKPVGTVWLAMATPFGVSYLRRNFLADRQGNRVLSANTGLTLLWRELAGLAPPPETQHER